MSENTVSNYDISNTSLITEKNGTDKNLKYEEYMNSKHQNNGMIN